MLKDTLAFVQNEQAVEYAENGSLEKVLTCVL